MVVNVFNILLMVIAYQNFGVSSGISIKKRIGSSRGKEKKLKDHATIYSSIFFNPILPATSVNDRKRAVSNAKIIQVIFITFYYKYVRILELIKMILALIFAELVFDYRMKN